MNLKPCPCDGRTCINEGLFEDSQEEKARLQAALDATVAVIREFVYPGSPKTPAQREALAEWEGLLRL